MTRTQRARLATFLVLLAEPGCRDDGKADSGDPRQAPFVPRREPEQKPTSEDDDRVPGPNLLWAGSPNERNEAWRRGRTFADHQRELLRNPRQLEPSHYHEHPQPRPGDTPLLIDIDQDGSSEIVGLAVKPGRLRSTTHVVVVDPETVTPRWLSLRLDAPGGAESKMLIQASNGVIVATTNDDHVLAFDPKTGEEIARTQAAASVDALCSVGRVIRAHVPGPTGVELDTETRTFRTTTEACPSVRTPERPHHGTPEGYEREDWRETNVGPVVRAQTKREGRAEVIAFEPDATTPRWTHVLGAGAVVNEINFRAALFHSDGRELFTEYEIGKVGDPYKRPDGTGEHHVVSLDVRSGAARWDVVGPRNAGPATGALITPDRLFVARSTQLEVYRRESGSLVGYLGWR
jgi:hypothetical protein